MARIEIVKEFTFEVAHRDGARTYGFSYRAEVALAGEIGSDGRIAPFSEIARAIEPLKRALDHSVLEEATGLVQPTLENLALWIGERLRADLPSLSRVSVFRDSEGEACHLTFAV